MSPAQLGWAFSAFTFAYAAFEIPTGWMGDVFGPRKVLTRIVLWWSAFTAATGLAWSFTSLVTVRFLFGWFHSWQTPLLIGGGVYILGGILTLLVNPEKPLETNA